MLKYAVRAVDDVVLTLRTVEATFAAELPSPSVVWFVAVAPTNPVIAGTSDRSDSKIRVPSSRPRTRARAA
jgi:hypothetical protein